MRHDVIVLAYKTPSVIGLNFWREAVLKYGTRNLIGKQIRFECKQPVGLEICRIDRKRAAKETKL